MKIHEYQAKALLRKFSVPVAQGELLTEISQLPELYKKLGAPVVAVKAQIHAGGRGKGGGVKIVKSLEEAKTQAEKILGMTLVTPQTGPEGQVVKKVYLEAGAEIAKEMYLAILLNRESSELIFVASAEGGMEIEELAETHPEKIFQFPIDPLIGFRSFQARELASQLGLEPKTHGAFYRFCLGLIEAYIKLDASLIEINPLVLTKSSEFVALDAKMTFDDNALYRQKEVAALRDLDEEDPLEMEAAEYGMSYISLDGQIGCMVNGAGLAMATMDVIKLAGAEPANFLDVGGSASEEAVTAAFKIILKDPKVKAILVNIFGGIMKCDIIANGIINAAKATGLKLPLVVRLQGTHATEGRQLLAKSGLAVITAESIDEAAQKVVEAAKKQAA
ncbi:MAG: ADP-forming succinate--CoA ligase subunit beta [Bradymonadales bacterium]|nr:MAG: ADP-forming succinate--CoA ligase subunit beta [Bradymonadales bacterium]